MAARLLSLLAFLKLDDIFPAVLERFTGGRKLNGGAREISDRVWHSYLSPDGPLDQYVIEAVFGVLRGVFTIPVAR